MAKRLVTVTMSVVGFVALAAPAVAIAPGVEIASSRFSIGLVGYVPVICRATVEANMVGTQEGVASLGSLNEFCNSPTGYKVYADHSSSLADANLVVDGHKVPLDGTGSTLISSSEGAAIESRDLSLELPENVEGGSLSFRIEAL